MCIKVLTMYIPGAVAKLTAALRYYETKYPQGDAEGLYEMKPEKDGEIVEQLKVFVDIVVYLLWYFITCFDCCRLRLLIYKLRSIKKKLLLRA